MRLFLLVFLSTWAFGAEPFYFDAKGVQHGNPDDGGVHVITALDAKYGKAAVDAQLLVYMKSLRLGLVPVPEMPVQNEHAKDRKKEEDRCQTAIDHIEACKSINAVMRTISDQESAAAGFTQEHIAKSKDMRLLILARNNEFMRNLEEVRGKLPQFIYKP